jgi:hypothetical protein
MEGKRCRSDENVCTSVDCVGFKIFAAVTMKNAVFWDIKTQPYLTGDTVRLYYRAKPVNHM